MCSCIHLICGCEFLSLISLSDLSPHRIGGLQLVGGEISCWVVEQNHCTDSSQQSAIDLITRGLISTVLHRFVHICFFQVTFCHHYFLRMGRMSKRKTNWVKARDRSTATRLGFLIFFPGSASLLGCFFWIVRINIECPGIHLVQQLRTPKHLLFITDFVQNLLLIYLYLEQTESIILCAGN